MENKEQLYENQYKELEAEVLKISVVVKEASKKEKKELKELEKKQEKDQQLFHQSLAQIINQEIQNIQFLGEQEIKFIEQKILSAWQNMFQANQKYLKDIRILESQPDPELQKLIEQFNQKLDELQKFAAQHNKKVPWNIVYSCCTNQEGKVDLGSGKGGYIMDSEGNPIWEVKCNLCNLVIEHGELGQGNPRMKCWDFKVNICQLCWKNWNNLELFIQKMVLNKGIQDQKSLEYIEQILNNAFPQRKCKFFEEYSHPVWTHVKILDKKTPGLMLDAMFAAFKNRPCIGKAVALNQKKQFKFNTYEEMGKASKLIACFLKNKFQIPERSVVGIYGYNCWEWIACDFACAYNNYVSVGVHLNYNSEQFIQQIQNAGIKQIICSIHQLETLVMNIEKNQNNLIEQIVLLEANIQIKDINQEILNKINQKKIRFALMHEILNEKLNHSSQEINQIQQIQQNLKQEQQQQEQKNLHDCVAIIGQNYHQLPKEKPLSYDPKLNNNILTDQVNETFTIIYTSGSTGIPKGVMLSTTLWKKTIVQQAEEHPLVSPSYVPFSHSSDRMRVWCTLIRGGRVGFCSYNYKFYEEDEVGIDKIELPDTDKILAQSDKEVREFLDDVKILKPTNLVALTRMWNELQYIYKQKVIQIKEKKTQHLQKDQQQQQQQQEEQKQQISDENEEADKEAVNYIRELLGGRVVYLVTGGTPTSKEIFNFIQHCFPEQKLGDSYGATECGGITYDGKPFPGVQIQLIDGEIVVKSDMVRTGYYNNGEETGKVFKNGWYHTGDLGVYDDKQNLKIIGRKKYQQKLKNGFEYDPEYLEIEFESCLEGIMKQIYIYGQENYDFLIAIVIPRTEKSEFKKENLKQDQYIEMIQKEMKQVMIQKKLDSNFNVPKKIVIDFEQWSVSNNLLTVTEKKSRQNIYNKYKDVIQKLFQNAQLN